MLNNAFEVHEKSLQAILSEQPIRVQVPCSYAINYTDMCDQLNCNIFSHSLITEPQ